MSLIKASDASPRRLLAGEDVDAAPLDLEPLILGQEAAVVRRAVRARQPHELGDEEPRPPRDHLGIDRHRVQRRDRPAGRA